MSTDTTFSSIIFRSKLYPCKEKAILYLPDTPWSLIIEPQDTAWGQTYCTDKNVRTVLP